MSEVGWIVGLLGLLGAAIIVFWNRRRTRKTMDIIEQMMDAAIAGSFTEETFNESRMSALESRFAHYFYASTVSARNLAAEKDKIKTLIADISHQTKTPAANLLLYCELLQEENLPESADDNINALYVQAKKLCFLMDALVKLSRLESGIISLSPQRQAVQPVLENVVKQFSYKANEKNLFLSLNNTEIFANFDAKWTTEALCNIVDNAVKYTDHGGVTISAVHYEMFIRIDIADSGIGIPEEEQAKIFARFYRSEKVQEQAGVGIGLYLAREIISNEGGYIKVASNVGSGAIFSVFLPA